MVQKKRKALYRILLIIILLIILCGGYLGYVLLVPNTSGIKKPDFLYVPTGATYQNVQDSLRAMDVIAHPTTLNQVFQWFDYPKQVKAGKYKLKAGMNNIEIVHLLRSGRQTPVRLIINKERTRGDVAKLLAQNLEPDSAKFMQIFRDSNYLSRYGFDTNTVICAIIPNTYQFFWNTTAKATYKRLVTERNKFWNDKRKTEADSLHLSPNEVYIIASIVEEETNKEKDKPLIASVYLNRLQTGMLLDADPTVKFAVGNFFLHRITSNETTYDSPYNTYIYTGLPPGPICTPSINTIDAVLHAPKTPYFYFCAKADFSGYHIFSKTYREHLKNARAYHKALDKQNIH